MLQPVSPAQPGRRRFLAACAAAGAAAVTATPASAGLAAQPAAWPSPFPALRQRINERPLAFLDSAATTLRPQSVIDALVDYYSTDNANPSPVHTLARRAAARLAAARQTVAAFVNAADPSEIVFTRGSTEGVNLIASTWGAANLKSGDDVVLTVAEHASNLMPWTRAAKQAGANIRVVDVDDQGRIDLDRFRKQLSPRTRLVAFSHVSNVLGYINPAKDICALARQAGTPDVAGPVGLAAAVKFFEAAGPLLQRHDEELVAHGLDVLQRIPGLRLIGPRTPERRVPVFTFTLEGHPPVSVAKALDAQGIAVRAGDMAALPLLQRFGTTEAVRASAYVYSTLDDVDRLGAGLRGLKTL